VDVAVLFGIAAVLAVVPALVDRWGLRRGVSPPTLAALALVTLFGLAALPVAFALCTSTLAAHDHGDAELRLTALAGLAFVAIATGRALARVVRVLRAWSALARSATALAAPPGADGARILPVAEPLAFVARSEAFVSSGLLERLSPAQRRAVIEHEREHVTARHGRMLVAARALRHALFDLPPARHAEHALHRELDALADRAAARRVGDPATVRSALLDLGAADDSEAVGMRIARLDAATSAARSYPDRLVGAITLLLAGLIFAAICASIHTREIWLGISACGLALLGFVSFTSPLRSSAARTKTPPPPGPPTPPPTPAKPEIRDASTT